MSINTVFIVGAGASKEAKLPTGYELKHKISRLLDFRFNWNKQESGDHIIAESLRLLVQQSGEDNSKINKYIEESLHIKSAISQAISIDNFIHAHRDNERIAQCGKLAITRSILEAEKNSILHFEKMKIDSSINFSSVENTWYHSFFQLITENCSKNELAERFKYITLVVFNYDRCIQHFIFHALKNYYRLSDAESSSLVKSIDIFHPYGNVGSLPWENKNDPMEFGFQPSAKQLLELSRKIKTFTESTDPKSSEIFDIRKKIIKANRIVFVGFAFHKLNMQLIYPKIISKSAQSHVKCFSTALGISESDKEVIEKGISGLYSGGVSVNMANLSCDDFFKEFWRSLSF